jgi:preprotein translocase subunit SecD
VPQPTAEELNQVTYRSSGSASTRGGVSEAGEINTQGASSVVVSIPGITDQATIDRIESSAKLEFRARSGVRYRRHECGPAARHKPEPSVARSAALNRLRRPPTNGSDEAYVTPALQSSSLSFRCDKVRGRETVSPHPRQTTHHLRRRGRGRQQYKYIPRTGPG